MNVLVACEFSGKVRDAFKRRGHNAMSCDFLDTERPGEHYKGDVLYLIKHYRFDLMIAHPPCTFLSNSGVQHLYKNGSFDPERMRNLYLGAEFFMKLYNADIPKKCIENPIMSGYAKRAANIPKQTQIVQPWMFGHAEVKATCLWLVGLQPLTPTKIIEPPYEARIHRMAPGPDRAKLRSETFDGIADAMAEQWG